MSESTLKGISAAALVCAVIAVIIPVYGLHVSALAILLAIIAALGGDRIAPVVAPIVTAVSIFLFSPTLWLVLGFNATASERQMFYMFVLFVLATPFIAMRLYASGTLSIRKP